MSRQLLPLGWLLSQPNLSKYMNKHIKDGENSIIRHKFILETESQQRYRLGTVRNVKLHRGLIRPVVTIVTRLQSEKHQISYISLRKLAIYRDVKM